MTIQKLQSGKLLILMKNEELARYGLSFQNMHENDEPTKRFLKRLAAVSSTALSLCARGCVVEALPGGEECILIVSPARGRRTYRIKRTPLPEAFRFETVDDLLDAYRRICSGGRLNAPQAQILGGAFVLCFDRPLSGRESHILSEYGVRLSPIALAALGEHQSK